MPRRNPVRPSHYWYECLQDECNALAKDLARQRRAYALLSYIPAQAGPDKQETPEVGASKVSTNCIPIRREPSGRSAQCA